MADETKILCLHGWRMNGSKIELDYGAIFEKPRFELLCPDAPHKAKTPPPALIASSPQLGNYEEGRQLMWWDADEKLNYVGMEQTLDLIWGKIKEEGIRGLTGFSQGGCVSLVSLLDAKMKGEREEEFNQIQFVITCCSPPPRDPTFLARMQAFANEIKEGKREKISTPILMFYGSKDVIVPYSEEKVQKFMEPLFSNYSVSVFEGRHVIPPPHAVQPLLDGLLQKK